MPKAASVGTVASAASAAVAAAANWETAEVARIFVLDIPEKCSFQGLRAHVDSENPNLTHLSLRQPALPIYDAIVDSQYVVKNPSDATVFFIASPLFLFDYNSTDGGARTAGGCVELVRSYVEGFANGLFWRRNQGRDHFILYASVDYPTYWHGPPQGPWRPDLPRRPYRSFLEEAWPGLRQSMVLTHGAVPDGKFYNARTERFSRYFFDVLRFVTVPPALPQLACEGRLSDRKYKVAFRGSANDNMWERDHLLQFMRTADHLKMAKGKAVLDVFSYSEKKTAFMDKQGKQHLTPEMHAEYKRQHTKNQSAANSGLWSQADVCLDLPGDGGYTVRAYDALRHGCVPLFVTQRHFLFPKLPFAEFIPWHKIAYFWTIDHAFRIVSCNRPVWRLAEQSCDHFGMLASYGVLFSQLLQPALRPAVHAKVKEAFKWLPALLWETHGSCDLRPAAMDFLARELHMRLALMQKGLASGFQPIDSFGLYGDLLQLKGVCKQEERGSCAMPFRPGGDPEQRVHPEARDHEASAAYPCPFGFPYLHRTFASDFCGSYHPDAIPEWLRDGRDEDWYYGIAWACPVGCLPKLWPTPGRLLLHEHFKLPEGSDFGEAWLTHGVREGPALPVNGSFRVCLQRGSAEGAKHEKWLPCRVPAALHCWRTTVYSAQTGLRFCSKSGS